MLPFTWQGVFGVLSVPAGLVILVGMLMRDHHVQNFSYRRVSQPISWAQFYIPALFFYVEISIMITLFNQVNQKLLDACKAMWNTLKRREVWRPCLYMYLSLALSLNVHEGMFYWYTDAKGGPAFSKVLQN